MEFISLCLSIVALACSVTVLCLVLSLTKHAYTQDRDWPPQIKGGK